MLSWFYGKKKEEQPQQQVVETKPVVQEPKTPQQSYVFEKDYSDALTPEWFDGILSKIDNAIGVIWRYEDFLAYMQDKNAENKATKANNELSEVVDQLTKAKELCAKQANLATVDTTNAELDTKRVVTLTQLKFSSNPEQPEQVVVTVQLDDQSNEKN